MERKRLDRRRTCSDQVPTAVLTLLPATPLPLEAAMMIRSRTFWEFLEGRD
jgi:hypothetical protein